jgi:hypothetical protein
MAHLLLTQLTGKRFEWGRGSLIAASELRTVTLLPFEPPMAVMPPPAACIPTSVTASQLTVIPRTPRTRHRTPSDARTTYQRLTFATAEVSGELFGDYQRIRVPAPSLVFDSGGWDLHARTRFGTQTLL